MQHTHDTQLPESESNSDPASNSRFNGPANRRSLQLTGAGQAGFHSPGSEREVKAAIETAGSSRPSYRLPEDDLERRRGLLGLMMGVLVVLTTSVLPVTLLLGLLNPGDIWIMICIYSGLLLSYIFMRLNRIKTAGYFLVYGIALGLVMRSLDLNGTNLSNLTFNYFAVCACIALAGLVINSIAPFVIATSSVIIFSVVFWIFIEYNQADANSVVQMLIYGAAVYCAMAFMSWANARAIEKTFRRLEWQNNQLLDVNRQLNDNLIQDSNIGDTINQLSLDLLAISQEQSNRAQSQAQSVTIVTSTLEELSATARQIAEVAESVFTATEQAMRTAETGGKSVGLSIDGIEALTSQVEAISRIANELGSQSRRISEIVETITELAEETNLLALNATIEAAGAGEYGRRFGVVAAEVQTLANRSRAASRDVQNILDQIRSSINSTLQATNDGLDEARRISEVSGHAGQAIEQIIETVESTTYLARQIFLTTQQQRSATDQAVEMVRQVADNSREAAVRAQRLLAAGDRLSQTATSLRRD